MGSLLLVHQGGTIMAENTTCIASLRVPWNDSGRFRARRSVKEAWAADDMFG